MIKLKHTVNLTLGDWSDDGHGKTDRICIKTNLTIQEIENAYRAGVKKLGVDLSKDVASDYEDRSISFEQYQKFVGAGCGINQWYDDHTCYDYQENFKSIQNKENLLIYTEIFIKLYLCCVKQGNRVFEFKIVKTNTNNINIGGYGLFY